MEVSIWRCDGRYDLSANVRPAATSLRACIWEYAQAHVTHPQRCIDAQSNRISNRASERICGYCAVTAVIIVTKPTQCVTAGVLGGCSTPGS